MKRVFPAGIFLLSFLFLLGTPHLTYAKKGGVGHEGGYSDQGVLYHSHSDRSYSGKDVYKGKGNPPGLEGKKKFKPGKTKGPGPTGGPGSIKGQGPTGGGTGWMKGQGSTGGVAPTKPMGPAPR
jgi:hypothetical protein